MMYQVQKDRYGCAIAAVANVCGVSYAVAKKGFVAKHAIGRGYYCNDVVRALKSLDRIYSFCGIALADRSVLRKEGVIVFVRSAHIPEGHYLARVNGAWVDSWVNFCLEGNLMARVGIRKRLPGKPEWVIFPV